MNELEELAAMKLEQEEAYKLSVYSRIKLSIMKLKTHKQILPTINWIKLFKKRFKDEELSDDLKSYLEWNCDNYKII